MSLPAVACGCSHLDAKITDATKNKQQKSKVASLSIRANVLAF